MSQTCMSVYASRDASQGYRQDGVHLMIDYAILVGEPGPGQVAISETARENKFIVHGSRMPFQLAVWTTDENIDEEKSWVRCTFRPAHDVGVSTVTSPLNPADTASALQGLKLGDILSDKSVDWEDWGMLERSYTNVWWSGGNWILQNRGKFEIAVQVGLNYTDGSDPVYCIVDPEMDLDPGNR